MNVSVGILLEMNLLRILLILVFVMIAAAIKPGFSAGKRGPWGLKFSRNWKKPKIFVPPSKKIAMEKESVYLSCSAIGHPVPRITWFHKGMMLKPSKNIYLSKMGTLLKIRHVSVHHRGEYVCKAANKYGMDAAKTFLKVGKMELPHVALHPRSHQKVKEGQNIVINCIISGRPMPYIHWEFHGRKQRAKFIGPRGKIGTYHHSRIYKRGRVIVEPGRLIIRDARMSDSGRYTCVGKSGKIHKPVVTFGTVIVVPFKMTRQHRDNLNNVEKFSREAHSRQTHLIRKTRMIKRFQVRQAPSFRERMRETYTQNPNNAHHSVRRDLFEHNLKRLRKSRPGPGPGLGSAPSLSREEINRLIHISKCLPKNNPKCGPEDKKYRRIDGTCNNLKHPNWGSAVHPFLRLLTADYSDGYARPVGFGKHDFYFGFRKPSPRDVSVHLLTRHTKIMNNHLSDFFNHFCQFLTHDNDLNSLPEAQIGLKYGKSCSESCKIDHPCIPILFTSEIDPHRKVPLPIDKKCFPFVRAAAICHKMPRSKSRRVAPPIRTQVNSVTSFTDASVLYGSSDTVNADLFDLGDPEGRAFTGPKGSDRMDSLPFANVSQSCSSGQKKPFPCFKTGDVRSNSHLMLVAMHTMFMRLHNLIAGQLLKINPHWSHEKSRIFQETRRMVIAIMQHIQYDEMLPLHLGPVGMKMLGSYKGYNSKTNPTISLEFAGGAERVGHYMANGMIFRLNHHNKPLKEGHLPLHISGFNTYAFFSEGGSPPLMRGTLRTKGKDLNSKQPINVNLADHLFEKPEKRGMDLASMDIMRGRDFGFQSYNHYRIACGLRWANSFKDLKHEIRNPNVLRKLEKLYGHPGNLDLVVGLALEDPIDGATVGPTGRCIAVEHFRRHRKGDRFWYENKMFTPHQMKFIKRFSLAKLVCLTNGGRIKSTQSNAFLQPHLSKEVSCYEYTQLNMDPWRVRPSTEHKDPIAGSHSQRISEMNHLNERDNFESVNQKDFGMKNRNPNEGRPPQSQLNSIDVSKDLSELIKQFSG